MSRALAFALLVFAAAIVSALVHELGHGVFYWLQGVPAGVSLVKEFPLRDITASQYAVGSLGGPVASLVLLAVSCHLYGRAGGAPRRRSVASAFVLANVLYFVLRGLIAVLKRRGGELDDIAGLVGLGHPAVVLAYAVISAAALTYWMRVGRVRATPRAAGAFVALLAGYVVVMTGLEVVDQALFWHRFPTVQIDDGRTYNEQR